MSNIRVRYITIEGDNAEVVSAALRALSLAEPAPAPSPLQTHELGRVETTRQPKEPRALPRAPRATASPARVAAVRSAALGGRGAAVAKPAAPPAARAPRIANGMARDVIRQAFASDENYPLNKLAAKLYGAADGRGVQKVKFNIAGLVAAGELVRLGATTYRVGEVRRASEEADDGDEVETLESDGAVDGDEEE